jgi:hypothetical protein
MNHTTTVELLGDAVALQAMDALRAGEKMPPSLTRLLEDEDREQATFRLGDPLPSDLAQFLLDEKRARAIPMEHCESCTNAFPAGTGFETDNWVLLCPACWKDCIEDPDCAVGWIECQRARLRRISSRFAVRSSQLFERVRAWLRDLPERVEAWEPTRRQTNICDLWVKTTIIVAALYLLIEVGRAFLPGGAAWIGGR